MICINTFVARIGAGLDGGFRKYAPAEKAALVFVSYCRKRIKLTISMVLF
jgi:hypothetical protein